jgi:Tfp pilus assembly protein PilF
MKKISTHTFKHTLRDICKNTENRKFCFVIGAGASRKSGIRTGGELAREWYDEIKIRLENKEFSKWVEAENIEESDLAASYGTIYRKRFENDKTSGYEFLVQEMKSAKPSLGHFVLAQILSRYPGHCVLTTNFDSLVESSVYQFTDKTPLVCGHESLSGYARPSRIHPLIVKIHRDLLLSPKSDPSEISTLDAAWNEPLDHIFSTHIPIIIGYGGNDGSLMCYFEKMNKSSNFFWCGIDENLITERVAKIIEKHDGSFVIIEGFDKLMHELLWVFSEIKPVKEELEKITNERIQFATKQLEEINKDEVVNTISESVTLTSEKEKKEMSALEYGNLADNEPNLEKRKQIYLEALEKYPETGWLWWKFTYFLHIEKEDYDRLDDYYSKALEFNKDEVGVFGNYALYLQNIKKDYVKAEEYFLRAISINNESAISYRNFAYFCYLIKKDYDLAKDYFLKSLDIDPNDVNANTQLSILFKMKKDYESAKKHLLKALEIDPNDYNAIFGYADLMKRGYCNLDEAEKNYLKLISMNPDNAATNGNYAQILLEKGQKEEARMYLDVAFRDKTENDLLIELWFYKYAHYPEFIQEAESKIEELLSKGLKSKGWNFNGNIEQAIKDGHPNPEKLKEFARRITSA